MKKIVLTSVLMVLSMLPALAQEAGLPKIYNEEINPIQQIDQACADAKKAGKFVIAQVGGNWCPWCLRFADFITKDEEISKVISDNFVYAHVNYPRRGAAAELTKKLNNAGRLGYPVFVVFDGDGKIVHVQDSSYLEEGKGYNKDKTLRFFKNWTPTALKGE